MPRTSQKEEIFLVARRLFSEKGYFGTTIRDIAKECGILSGSLYAHIESKEELLFLIVDEGANSFLSALQPISDSSEEPFKKLQLALSAHIRVVANHLDSARVFLHEWHALSGERYQVINEKRKQYEDCWTKIFEEGVQRNVFKNEEIRMMRLLVLSAANWVYQWYQADGPYSPEMIADRFSHMLLFGISKV